LPPAFFPGKADARSSRNRFRLAGRDLLDPRALRGRSSGLSLEHLKLRNLSFLGSDQMDNLLKDHI
jgi:hypothetical protein